MENPNQPVIILIDEYHNKENGEEKLLVYLFVGGKAVEEAANCLDSMIGKGTVLDDKHIAHDEQTIIRL